MPADPPGSRLLATLRRRFNKKAALLDAIQTSRLHSRVAAPAAAPAPAASHILPLEDWEERLLPSAAAVKHQLDEVAWEEHLLPAMAERVTAVPEPTRPVGGRPAGKRDLAETGWEDRLPGPAPAVPARRGSMSSHDHWEDMLP